MEAVSNAEVAAKALMREVGKVIKKRHRQKQSKSLLQTSVFFPLSG